MPPDPPYSEIESALLAAIREFFEARESSPEPLPEEGGLVTGRRLQLATAILFLQMIAADRESKHDEHRALVSALSTSLRMDGRDAVTLIRLAEAHVKTPLRQLVEALKDRCTPVQLKSVVTGLWQLAFADADLAGHEEYYVRKIAFGLGLSTADLVETKILAREAFR